MDRVSEQESSADRNGQQQNVSQQEKHDAHANGGRCDLCDPAMTSSTAGFRGLTDIGGGGPGGLSVCSNYTVQLT